MADENIFKKIGNGIVDFAPTLGTLLTATGVGAPVGMAVNALAALGKAFGLGTTPTPTALATALLNDPEAQAKVIQCERDFTVKMREMDVQELITRLKDVQGSRDMHSGTEKNTGKSDINLYVLAWTIVTGFFVLMGILIFISLPPDAAGVLFMLFGALSAGFGQVLAFFFGSNKSSESKTNMIYNSTPNSPKAAV